MSDARKKRKTSADGLSPAEVDPIAPMVQNLLRELGEDPTRDGLEQTPSRVAKALRFFTEPKNVCVRLRPEVPGGEG